MISLTFLDFFKQNYDDVGYELYFVKDETGKALYIGISTKSIWYRWFGTATSHLVIDANNHLHGSSHIGQVVKGNLPHSWAWTIELWTKKDCWEFLEKELGNKSEDRITIKDLESSMISRYTPLYNILHAGGYHEDPSARKRLDDEYKKIFG